MKPMIPCLRPALLAAACTLLIPIQAAPTLSSKPFAPKSGALEKMGFTAIPATESGLVNENPYDDPAMWSSRYLEFSTGSIGSGIAVGDVDGDGLADIFVANKTRPSQLFRQVSPFKFMDITTAAGVAGPAAANGTGWKTGATMADVNGDGALDLYVCRFNAPNLLYLNDGKGHFKETAHAAGVDLVSGSVVGAFEDYDRDGRLDLFVLANISDAARSPDGETARLYHNRGDGTFEEVAAKAGISREPAHGHSATWLDYNADGWPDLYVANDFAAPDFFYRNNGDGTFTDILAVAAPHTTWFSMGSDSGDINNDGLPDLLVSEMAGTTHFKSKVAMGDMGGLVNLMDTLVTPQYMKNAVFLNSGTDRFLEVAKMTGLGSTDWSWSPRFEDLDNDGWVDLHVTNGMVRPFIDSDLLNQIKKLQSPSEIIALMKRQPPQRETHLAFRNDHNLRFAKVQKDWGLDHTGVSFGSALADFDHDGDLDLVYVNYEDGLSLYRNDCPKGNSITLRLQGPAGNRYGVGALVLAKTEQGTQMRRLTVARGALSSSDPILHFGLGDSKAVAELEIRWPDGQVQKFPNLPANQHYVVTQPVGKATRPAPAVASRPVDRGLLRDQAREIGLDFANTERAFDDMRRQSLLPNRMNTLGGGLAWGDANADGHPDLFFPGGAGRGCALYLNDGTGHFARSRQQQPWDDTIEREAMSALFTDVNRDGAMDLLVVAGGVEADKGSDLLRSHLYLNNGHGKFTEAPATQFSVPASSSAAACAADWRHTGALGFFIGGRVVPGEYPTAPESVLLENRDGTFVDVTDTAMPGLRRGGMVTAALWTDADADGWVDLLVTGEWMPLRLFHNNHDGTFTETTEAAGLAAQTGWWNSLTSADVNRDGFTDYIAGNVGLNTKYHANAEHPTGIYYVDIEGDGRPQIIESEYEGDKLYPVRGRSCSSRAMPSLKGKFPTFHDFGAALLPEIYSDEKLAGALHLTATELASGVFLNDGHGKFTFRAFPRLAQTSPIFGTAAADFNGDGLVDIVAVQNFAGPQVETGRFDGGLSLLLLGDGQGGFTPATAQQSGLAIPGDARAVAVCDWNRDGRPDLVVTRINEPVLAYTQRSEPAAPGFAVALKGQRGNPDAIGARITVRFKDGTAQTAELQAGASYLAQSEPLSFFSYATTNVPTGIEVTWPDGSRTTHPFQLNAPRLTLTK
ncbi:MAG TPA: FG-GAP-like repeat-containing protein [Lacunisphaera sp.]